MPPLSPDMLDALNGPIAAALRWSGAIARQLRRFDVAIAGKTSGNAHTDALTLADLSVEAGKGARAGDEWRSATVNVLIAGP